MKNHNTNKTHVFEAMQRSSFGFVLDIMYDKTLLQVRKTMGSVKQTQEFGQFSPAGLPYCIDEIDAELYDTAERQIQRVRLGLVAPEKFCECVPQL